MTDINLQKSMNCTIRNWESTQHILYRDSIQHVQPEFKNQLKLA